MKIKDLRLLLSFGSSRKLFLGSAIAAVLNTSIVICNGFVIATVIIDLINQRAIAVNHIALLAIVWAFRSLFISLFDRWASVEASILKENLRLRVVDSAGILISTPSTHLSTLLIKGGNSLDIYLARFLPQIFSASLTPFAVIGTIFFCDRLSALIAILTIPLIPVFGALIGRYTQDAVEAKWQSLGTLGKYFEDSLRGIHTLSIFSRLKSQDARIAEMGDKYTDETMKVLRVSFLSALVLELAATISVALIAVSIGLRLVSGSMEFFPALAILVLAPEVYFPLRNAASLFHASADGGAALSQLTTLIENHPIEQESKNVDELSMREISWQQWESPYSNGLIPAGSAASGQSIVIRGGSGLGKTTFLNSIMGFGSQSQILINGNSIVSANKKSLRSQIGWIPQNPSLISGSVRELFQFLNSDISDEEIVSSLERVGLTPSDLPHGIDTALGGLGEKSGKLSGGQIRRIAIARALYASPSLIIADEPTADLDPASAQAILRILESEAQRGAIVIAVLHAPDHVILGAKECVMVER